MAGLVPAIFVFGFAPQARLALHGAPLCPAGHLPHKGEIGSFGGGALPAILAIGEGRRDI